MVLFSELVARSVDSLSFSAVIFGSSRKPGGAGDAQMKEIAASLLDRTALLSEHLRKRRPGYLSRYSDSLRAGRSGDRIPVWARFSAPVQTGPGAHPTSYTMGTGPFPGVKRPGRGIDHPSASSAEVQERVELYLLLWAFVTCSG